MAALTAKVRSASSSLTLKRSVKRSSSASRRTSSPSFGSHRLRRSGGEQLGVRQLLRRRPGGEQEELRREGMDRTQELSALLAVGPVSGIERQGFDPLDQRGISGLGGGR
jgi:hypothetical protein